MILEQILLTNSLRNCMEISVENLYVDTGAWWVKIHKVFVNSRSLLLLGEVDIAILDEEFQVYCISQQMRFFPVNHEVVV